MSGPRAGRAGHNTALYARFPYETGVGVQATKIAGGNEAFAMEVLPQIFPIFTTPPAQRALYGSSTPAAAAGSPRAAAQSGRPDVGARMAQALALTVGHGQIRQIQ